MAHMTRKDDKPDDLTVLKNEIDKLQATVATLVEKVAKLEAHAGIVDAQTIATES